MLSNILNINKLADSLHWSAKKRGIITLTCALSSVSIVMIGIVTPDFKNEEKESK